MYHLKVNAVWAENRVQLSASSRVAARLPHAGRIDVRPNWTQPKVDDTSWTTSPTSSPRSLVALQYPTRLLICRLSREHGSTSARHRSCCHTPPSWLIEQWRGWPGRYVFASTRSIRLKLTIMPQIEVIEAMNVTADPTANFKLVIVQTELERFKFLVRSLLRARIAKVSSISIT